MKKFGVAMCGFALIAVSGCRAGSAQRQLTPSVKTKVWDRTTAQLVEESALGLVPEKQRWIIDLAQFKTYDVSEAGIFALTKSGQVKRFDPATGSPTWDMSAPLLAGTAPEKSFDFVKAIQIDNLSLLALTREIETPEDRSIESARQIDMFNAETGEFLWTRVGSNLDAPIKISHDQIAFDLYFARKSEDNSLPGFEAVDPLTGEFRWTKKHIYACDTRRNFQVCETEKDGEVVLIDPQNGKQLWSAMLPKEPNDPSSLDPGPVRFDVAIGNTLYVSLRPYSLSALDIATGKIKWTVNPGVGQIRFAYPLDAAHILLGAENGANLRLVSIASVDGAEQGFYNGTGGVGTKPRDTELSFVVVQNQSYFVLRNSDGSLRVLDTAGKEVAKAATDCRFRSELHGDTYFCTEAKGITLFSIPGLQARGLISEVTDSFFGAYRADGNWFLQQGESVRGFTAAQTTSSTKAN